MLKALPLAILPQRSRRHTIRRQQIALHDCPQLPFFSVHLFFFCHKLFCFVFVLVFVFFIVVIDSVIDDVDMRVRLVEVAEYHELSVLITTLVCKTMNCIAQAVCRQKDDWWK